MPPSPAIVVFGEALIDLFPPAAGIALEEADALIPRQGGAPANVAVHLARRDCSVSLLSAVGDDPFGRRVLQTLEHEGVDVSGVVVRPRLRTGVTLVELGAGGERRFTAYRENAADLSLAPEDLDKDLLTAATLVHAGTVTLRTASARQATRFVRDGAPHALQTLDVNLRPGMFDSLESLCVLARDEVPRAHVVKLARDEAIALYGEPSSSNASLLDKVLATGARLVLLTLDADGAFLATPHVRVHVPSPQVQVVDATGAGDAFMAAALSMLPHNPEDVTALTTTDLTAIGACACAAGAEATTIFGACGPPQMR